MPPDPAKMAAIATYMASLVAGAQRQQQQQQQQQQQLQHGQVGPRIHAWEHVPHA